MILILVKLLNVKFILIFLGVNCLFILLINYVCFFKFFEVIILVVLFFKLICWFVFIVDFNFVVLILDVNLESGLIYIKFNDKIIVDRYRNVFFICV